MEKFTPEQLAAMKDWPIESIHAVLNSVTANSNKDASVKKARAFIAQLHDKCVEKKTVPAHVICDSYSEIKCETIVYCGVQSTIKTIANEFIDLEFVCIGRIPEYRETLSLSEYLKMNNIGPLFKLYDDFIADESNRTFTKLYELKKLEIAPNVTFVPYDEYRAWQNVYPHIKDSLIPI